MKDYNGSGSSGDNLAVASHGLQQAIEALYCELGKLVYGEVTVNDDTVFISRDGLPAIPIGKYSPDLVAEINENNATANALKERISNIKSLINYEEIQLSEDCRVCATYAKTHLVDMIYCQAILEGVKTNFLDTKSIIENDVISNMRYGDAVLLFNLKRAWNFLLDRGTLSWPTTFSLLQQLNKKIGEDIFYDGGVVRSIPVTIDGTSYVPPVPVEAASRADFNDLLSSDRPFLDKAVDLLLFVMKQQLFVDGNKRCAILIANHFLISNGDGVLLIPEDKNDEFKSLLLSYYEGSSDAVKDFLKGECFVPRSEMAVSTIVKSY